MLPAFAKKTQKAAVIVIREGKKKINTHTLFSLCTEKILIPNVMTISKSVKAVIVRAQTVNTHTYEILNFKIKQRTQN